MRLTWNRTSTRALFTTLTLGAAAVALVSAPAPQWLRAQEEEVVEKDVPYVPTPQEVVDKMLEMAQVKEGDVVYDLGCGDGRIIVTAAQKFGATGVGVDIDPQRIRESNENAKKAGVTDKVKFIKEDLFKMNFGEANVLAMYLLPSVNLELRPKIMSDMKPGSRVVSHAFDMGDWEPDQQTDVEGRTVYFWVVPAQVEGKWKAEMDGKQSDVSITQKHQTFTGTVSTDGAERQIAEGKINGKTVTFTLADGAAAPAPGGAPNNGGGGGAAAAGGKKYTATLNDDGTLTGHAEGNEQAKFTAKREGGAPQQQGQGGQQSQQDQNAPKKQ